MQLLIKAIDAPAAQEAIDELVRAGVMDRVRAAESVFKERCIPVDDVQSWARYMAIDGSGTSEYRTITLQVRMRSSGSSCALNTAIIRALLLNAPRRLHGTRPKGLQLPIHAPAFPQRCVPLMSSACPLSLFILCSIRVRRWALMKRRTPGKTALEDAP